MSNIRSIIPKHQMHRPNMHVVSKLFLLKIRICFLSEEKSAQHKNAYFSKMLCRDNVLINTPQHLFNLIDPASSHMLCVLRTCHCLADAHACGSRLSRAQNKHTRRHPLTQFFPHTVAERSLLSVAYKNAVDSRRAFWRIIISMEQDKIEGNEQEAAHVRQYAVKLEAELQKVCEGILALMDENPIPSTSTGKSKVFHCKMKDDCYRYLAELATHDTRSEADEDANVVDAEATKITEKHIDKTVDVPVVKQGRVPTTQTAQKTVEESQVQYQEVVRHVIVPQVMTLEVSVPVARPYSEYVDVPYANPIVQTMENIVEVLQVQFLDQVVDVPVVAQGQMPRPSVLQEQIQERIAEKTMEATVPRVMEKITELMKPIPQERVPACQEETVEVIQVGFPTVSSSKPSTFLSSRCWNKPLKS